MHVAHTRINIATKATHHSKPWLLREVDTHIIYVWQYANKDKGQVDGIESQANFYDLNQVWAYILYTSTIISVIPCLQVEHPISIFAKKNPKHLVQLNKMVVNTFDMLMVIQAFDVG